jgi:hypothetical protein
MPSILRAESVIEAKGPLRAALSGRFVGPRYLVSRPLNVHELGPDTLPEHEITRDHGSVPSSINSRKAGGQSRRSMAVAPAYATWYN